MHQLAIQFPNDKGLENSIEYVRNKLERDGNTIFMESRNEQDGMIVVTFSYIGREITDKEAIRLWTHKQ